MRIVKEAEQRRHEILDAAEALFGEKGFDGTSTNDILAAVGIARGTLYYHFKSKEDIMDALIERYGSRLLEAAQRLASDRTVPVDRRIVHVVMGLNVSGTGSNEIMEHIHKPQNALMHQKTQKMIINGLTPILADIIREGVEQGLFNTPYPYECMEMVIVYATTVFDGDLVELTEEERAARMRAFLFHLGRLLNLQEEQVAYFMQMLGGGEQSVPENS